MSHKPIISVVLTTHHRPALLTRALNSLLSQEVQNFEIILCADEGAKETKNIAHLLLRPQDSFISVPNLMGPAQTRNLGIQVAQGEWLCFLDDDDSFGQEYFKSATNILVNKNAINYFNYTEIKELRTSDNQTLLSSTDKIVQSTSVDQIEIGNCIPINALFVPAEIAKQNLFDVNLQSHEDWDWLIGLKSRKYPFIKHEYFGPNVYVDENLSRNSESIQSGSRTLDFLSIYRKWPGSSNEIKHARANQMAAFGLPIPSIFL